MIDAEPTPESSAGTKPAGAATGEKAGCRSKAPAAGDSPGSHPAQAASAALRADAVNRSSGQAEAAKPGFVPEEYGARAAAGSAGSAPDAGSGEASAGLSLEGLSLKGQPSSSDRGTGGVGADGSPPAGASAPNALAERSTAHGAPSDGKVWDARDGTGGEEHISSTQRSPVMPCSATARGTGAAVDSAGQLAACEAGRQPAGADSTQREASSSTHTARTGNQQAAHDSQAPDLAQVCSCGLTYSTPPAIPSWLCHPS